MPYLIQAEVCSIMAQNSVKVSVEVFANNIILPNFPTADGDIASYGWIEWRSALGAKNGCCKQGTVICAFHSMASS